MSSRARGIVSSPASGARVQACTYAPPPDLSDVVESFWVGRWDLRGQPPHVTELLGDPAVHIVAEAGASRVVGVWTRRWVRRLEGRGLVRAAKLRPGAVGALFDGPAIALTDQLNAFGPTWGTDAEAFERRILQPRDDEEAFVFLADWIRRRRRPDPRGMQRAIEVCASLGEPDVWAGASALAARSGMEVRTMQRMFRAHVGASPKTLLRRARLQEGIGRLESGAVPSLAGLALDLGYADQAHFSRDVKAVIGKTPRQLRALLRAT
ncbi:MAG: helix-turn-helix domain-containing protein [Sandaracinaceae bacterium]